MQNGDDMAARVHLIGQHSLKNRRIGQRFHRKSMHPFSLLLAYCITFFSLISGSTVDNVTELYEDQYVDWEFEPRVWSDEAIELVEENGLQEEQTVTLGDDADQSQSVENPRQKHHFVGPNINLRQHTANEECNQFRVDSREAVICDRDRCDKLDFEWPTFDNQIALIETTQHGMRFHRVDYAFSSNLSRHQKVSNQVKSKKPANLDIFELFKPKPQPSTVQPITGPNDASTNGETSTLAPVSTTKSPRDYQRESIDTNATQLIATLRLDTGRRKQTMIGFGGALSDSTCRNIKSLSPDMARSLMEDYYGERGIKYNIVRMSIGSSDFSTTPYTNNDKLETKTATDDDDLEMNNFRMTEEDYQFKLPIARQAIATSRQELKFFASLWSPPTWMKNNSHIVHGYLKGDVYGPYYKALAELMIKWLEAYRRNGLDFWAVTGLNEPVTGVKPFIFHNSLGISRDDYVTFFKLYLGPMMARRGFQNVKLLMLDDNKGYAPNWVKAMLEDPEASKYISGVAFHWYMNDEYENLNFISKLYPDKFIISSEACNGFLPFQTKPLPGNWDRGTAYMLDIIKMIQKNAAAWVDWNMALDLTGGPSWANNLLDAAIIVNGKRDEYYKSPMFYAMGHFSRFVAPNSTRLDHRLANARFDYPFEAVAFHNQRGYIIVVALNANRHQVPLRIVVDKQPVRVVPLRSNSFNTIVFKWKGKSSYI